MNPDTILGVDPGATGAICLRSGCAIEVHRLPKDPWVLATLLEELRKQTDRAVVEKVHSSPQMGVTSAFSFGRSFGAIQGTLAALEYRVQYVSPLSWKRTAGLLVKGGTMVGASRAEQNAKKSAAHQLACRMFPRDKIAKYAADAVLLASLDLLQPVAAE